MLKERVIETNEGIQGQIETGGIRCIFKENAGSGMDGDPSRLKGRY